MPRAGPSFLSFSLFRAGRSSRSLIKQPSVQAATPCRTREGPARGVRLHIKPIKHIHIHLWIYVHNMYIYPCTAVRPARDGGLHGVAACTE